MDITKNLNFIHTSNSVNYTLLARWLIVKNKQNKQYYDQNDNDIFYIMLLLKSLFSIIKIVFISPICYDR